MAECHPVGFHWVMEAKRRGATIIHVDPRFTRTSAVSDIHAPLRAGSDIAFLGGIVNYILTENRHFEDYVVHYTNASAIISEKFQDTENLDGLFSGWDGEKKKYETESWQYEDSRVATAPGQSEQTNEPRPTGSHDWQTGGLDPSLQHPRCVFQILKRHFARYTPALVEELCGVSQELFARIAKTICDASGRDKTTAFCYSVGWTQHSVGAQYIRTAAIIQLLLGNVGRPGGGILALRGHASIQGSTDIPTLYNLLPGYLPMPKANSDPFLGDYLANNQSSSGWWSELPKCAVSLLKAYFGDAATDENDFCYDHLPRLTGDHSHMTTVADMADGRVKGYFVMGENPTVGSMNGALQRKGLRAAEWVVVRDFAPTETAEFWRDAPEIHAGEVRTEDIGTEVFFFPCAAHTEKDGAFTNTQRMLQWHHAAVPPPGDARSELHFVFHLGRKLKKLYRGSTDPKDRAVLDLAWDYPVEGPHQEPDAEAVLAEINGYVVADGRPVPGFSALKDDGSTACGCWIYSGCRKEGVNQTARRKSAREQSWVAPEWGWAWPANRRVLYNRASADPEGRPWSEAKRYVWWDDSAGKWTGHDVPDFIAERPPSYRPGADAQGLDTISGDDPFIMQADGKGWLFAPTGLLDGPLPTHYEPQESVVRNSLYGQQCNPARMEWLRKDNRYHRAFNDPRFPFLITTYRLTEHHTAGGMSRWLSWLSELQPEMFCEVSPELARLKDLVNGGWATVSTARAQIECRVLVTERIPPLRIKDRVVHQIGLPYHWGSKGLSTGDSANDLISFVADPNVSIQESKALTGDIRRGRRGKFAREKEETPLLQDALRDVAAAGDGPSGAHGMKHGESHEGHKT
jgi:formate dehydrogenase major subunit